MATFKLFNNHIRVTFLLLAICEAGIFFGSVYLAIAARFATFDFDPALLGNVVQNLPLKAGVFSLIHMLSMTALGLYQVDQFRGRNGFMHMMARIFVSVLIVGIVLSVIWYAIPVTQLGRGISFFAFAMSLVGIIAARRIFFATVDNDIFINKILVLGCGKSAASLLETSQNSNNTTYRIKGFIATPEQQRVVPDECILELGDSLLRLARERDVNEVIVALDDRRQGYPVQHLLDCKLAGIKIIDPVSFLERELGKVNLALLNPSWMIFSEGFSASFIKSFISRLFDIVASLLILVLTSPILLLTMLMIAIESGFREPIFYRQERVGKNGETFQLLKFRSMVVNAERNGAQWAAQNDMRVTRIGKIIRKFRIDELPQILNILKGDMRLVGPRPERPEFVTKLSQSIAMYNQRHTVKPGLAGWAQLKYPYGASEEDAYEKLQYDLYYIKNANPIMDFFILLQTLEVVIFGKGVR